MTEAEKLKRDIETLMESIRLDWAELASKPLTPEERHAIRQHIAGCAQELVALIAKV